MSLRRILPYLLINILVSATVVIIVLSVWEKRSAGQSLAQATTETSTVAGNPTLAAPGALPTATEAASAAPTPTPEPTDACYPTHVIQTGETLGSVSLAYDTPLADIIAYNEIGDPNFVQVGLRLVIPVCGPATPTPTAAPVVANPPTATPIPTLAVVTSGPASLTLAVVDVGNPATEAIVITNTGAAPVVFTGWTLRNGAGQVYTFGQITLFGDGAALRVHTGAGADSATELYWGLTQAVWVSADSASLRDSAGNLQASLTIP